MVTVLNDLKTLSPVNKISIKLLSYIGHADGVADVVADRAAWAND